ncbi:MAG TPA: hypothetical protein VLE22_10765 [Bryobacteraceae bacterium]|nr:hypothetical protein [Bryobacteraceae bacterium]
MSLSRRHFLLAGPLLPALRGAAPAGLRESEPVPEPHFPSRLYQFVWRNWELANTDRMAEVAGATPRQILDLGESMGLPAKPSLSEDQLRRIYITVIRQNWHLLPEPQIIKLLGWSDERFRFTLKEDDFLDIKLGLNKPRCPELRYDPPSEADQHAAARIRETLRAVFGDSLRAPGQRSFQFVEELSDLRFVPMRDPSARPAPTEIDLTSGWSIAEPEGDVLASAARRLREFLRDAMGVSTATGGKHIVLEVRPPGNGPGSFDIAVSEAAVRITGDSDSGALQGVYWLMDQMEEREAPFLRPGVTSRKAVWNPRFLYSHFALYGDPLMEPEADPFPDAYLEKLARRGINGVWMQAVLNNLAPSKQFPEFGEGSETRLRNLDALVRRAARFGISIYLYLNEPRAMPPEFFRAHPETRGSSFLGTNAMCTSVPAVREWIADALTHVVRHAPGIGGFFSITMSENHTNCFSHGGAWGKAAPNAGDCPRCAQRKSWDVIAELITTFRDGVRRGGSSAHVIAWDWGWGDDLTANLIPLLPKDVRFQSISEWDQPVNRGGVPMRVGEYSISVVGPGPRATRNWERARKSGVTAMAKTQFNNTWEISAAPWIPAVHLIARHCENLTKAGIAGIMASWTCGGYPSPNLSAAKAFYFEPRESTPAVLRSVAARRYGRAAAGEAVEAWRRFSEAFEEYPYGVAVYIIPTQHGPANLLRLEPTGHAPGMILFPHDDYKAWCGKYPPEVVQRQFGKMAALWNEGLTAFRDALAKVSPRKKANASADLAVAETCYHHFRSTANQVEFYILRDRLRSVSDAERAQITARMRAIVEDEIDLARRQYWVARANSAIAYEASNHYYYRPLDLVEKVLNCRDILARLK